MRSVCIWCLEMSTTQLVKVDIMKKVHVNDSKLFKQLCLVMTKVEAIEALSEAYRCHCRDKLRGSLTGNTMGFHLDKPLIDSFYWGISKPKQGFPYWSLIRDKIEQVEKDSRSFSRRYSRG